ncbi:MAG TPA: hypothetical protein VFP94_04070 [Terriglobales bacterium]|nr:hypothetical protein [Terriglobales bacterium]
MPGETNWKPYLIGLAVTCVFVAVVWVAMTRQSEPSGARNDAYAAQVEIQSPQVSAAESMMGGGVVYYDGTLQNRGGRTLTGYIVDLTFHNIEGQPIQTVRRTLLDDKQLPVPPRGSRQFEIGFDQFPAGWNQAPPTPRAVAVYVR